MKGSSVASSGVASRSGWKHFISQLQGSTVRFDLSGYAASIAAIADLEHELREFADDEIRHRSQDLTGPGGATIAIYSAVMMMPLLIVWGLIEKLLRRGERRRSDPFGS